MKIPNNSPIPRIYVSRMASRYKLLAYMAISLFGWMWIRSEALGQETLTWNVAGSGTWDTTTADWSGGATTYTDGDFVNFENPSGGAVTIQGAGVNPGSVNVSVANTSGTYTFTGGAIGGGGALTMSGNGSLVLEVAVGSVSQSTSIAVGKGASLTLGGNNADYVTMPTTKGDFAGALNIDVASGVTIAIASGAVNPAYISGSGGTVNVLGSGASLLVGDATAGGSGTVKIDNNIALNSGSAAGSFSTSFGGTDSNQLTITGTLTGNSDVHFFTASHFDTPTIILSASNTYTGGTYLDFSKDSILQLGTNNALPTGTELIFAAANGAAGALDLNGYNQTVAALSVATSNGVGNVNGITNTGATTSTLTVDQNSNTTYGSDIGTLADNLTGPNVNNINLVKKGTGELRLLGNYTYTGTTSVQGGTLIVNGGESGSSSLGIAQTAGVTVTNGATLAGRGFIGVAPGGQVVIGPGGTISPGDQFPGSNDYATGEMTISDPSATPSPAGTFDLESNATLYITLGAQTAGGSQNLANSGPGFDSQVAVQGNITLNGNLGGTLLSGFTANLDDLFFIILNNGTNAINGTFTGYPQGSIVTLTGAGGSQNFQIGYHGSATENTFGGGNDVVLELVVPEPGSEGICIGGLGMLAICGVYRRKYGYRSNRPQTRSTPGGADAVAARAADIQPGRHAD
jgi:autotransporter-associated beta strand protein